MKRTIALLVVLGIAAAACVFRFFANPFHEDPGPKTMNAQGVVTTRHHAYTTRPLSRSELTASLLPVPIPPEASDIQFAEYREWQAYEMYVRFRAPTDVCGAYAKALIDNQNAKPQTKRISEFRTMTTAPAKVSSTELSIDWFTPDTIKTGSEAGDDGSWNPRIWIDSERGIFYYRLTD